MSVAKVIELNSESSESFEDAINKGIQTAAKTVHNLRGAWVQEQTVKIENNRISAYRVNLKLTFILE